MKIRKATKKDWKEIYKIMKKEFKKHFNEVWTFRNTMKTLEHFNKNNSKIFVAISDKQIVGFIIVREEYYNKGKSYMIEELAVDGNFQKKGIGKALVKNVEDFAKKNKVKRILLTTGKNKPAFKFYKKLGYVDSKRTVLMRKKLNEI